MTDKTFSLEEVAARSEIKSVDFEKGKVKIKFAVWGGDVTFNLPEAPAPEFDAAMTALRRFAFRVLDFGEEMRNVWGGSIMVTGVTIKPEKSYTVVSFKLNKILDSACVLFQFQTPFVPVYIKDEKRFNLGEDGQKAIDNMLQEAKNYIAGKRAQGQLFTEEE